MKRLRTKAAAALLIALVLCLQLFPVGTGAAVSSGLTGVWTGQYTGHSGGSSVERRLRLDIDYAAGGRVEGFAAIDDGANGRYFFSGTVEADGSIRFQGEEWISNPSNFSFVEFTGFYNESAGTISGVTDGSQDNPFTLRKVSDDYRSSRIDLASLPREWNGEYDGASSNVVVRRVYEIHIQSITEAGDIRGVAIIAPSEKADAVYGANGSYYFSGSVSPRTGRITLQGYEWIDYPDSSATSNWTFVYLEGYINLTGEAAIHGWSENGIWEMTAIDYGSIHRLSGFTLGRDNNSFRHTDNAQKSGAGFAGVTTYHIDDAYFR